MTKDSRLEKFLKALCSLDYSDLPTPLSRVEVLWNCLITGEETPDFQPQSRTEKYLMTILGVYDLEDIPQPISRAEMLLYKLATGDTDIELEDGAKSRYERLLSEIITNGGVGGVVFEYVTYVLSESYNTLYNTVEKPVKSAILKGNTLVNMCDDGVADASDIERFTHNYTGNGGTFEQVSDGIKATTTQDDTFLIVGYDIRSQQRKTMTIGKKYYGVADVTVHNLTNSDSCELIFRTNYPIRENISLTNGRGLVQSVFTHGSVDDNYGWLAVGTNVSKAVVGDSFTVHSMSVYEITEEEVNLSYEELANKYPVKCVGMQSVKMPGLKTVGKNLFSNEFEVYGATSAYIEKYKNGFKCLHYIDSVGAPYQTYQVKPSTNYTISFDCPKGNGYLKIEDNYDTSKALTMWFGANGDERFLVRSFTTLSDKINVYFFSHKKSLGIEAEIINIQLEESPTQTEYEPYKSNILTVNEDIELRGIGEVKDELNLLTGGLTQRVGQIVLDGYSSIETWTLNHTDNPELITFAIPNVNLDFVHHTYKEAYRSLNSDKFNVHDDFRNNRCILTHNDTAANIKWLVITVKRTELSTSDVAGFRSYLNLNPVTVQYQLATPVVETVDLSTLDQDDNKTKLKTFDDITYVTLSSEGLIPEAEMTVVTKNLDDISQASTMSLRMNDISEKQCELQNEVDTQSESIDSTMMATTEIYEQTL